MGAQDGTGHDEAGLEAVRFMWGDAYEFGHDERGYWARDRDGAREDILAGDLGPLRDKVAGAFAARRVPPPREPVPGGAS